MWIQNRPYIVPERPFPGHYQDYQPSYQTFQPVFHAPPPFAAQLLHPPPVASGTNDLAPPAPQRRKRASKPKVRTGCVTCKIRRIKCDETKPSCKRCTSTGRKCDGYEFQRDPADEAGSVPPSSPPKAQAPRSQLSLPFSISPAFQGSPQERRIFHRFQECTLPAFLGGSEANFWTSLVLKVGCEEPVVRNAIIALGTLHEDYQTRGGRYSKAIIRDPSHQHALQLYGNALRQLNRQLSEGTKTKAKLAIISSILFACFEVLRRNNMAAVIHYQAGMRELLRQMNLAQQEAEPLSLGEPTTSTSSTPSLQLIPQDELNTLLRVFARYDVQACTFAQTTPERIQTTLSPVPPTSFAMSDVRNHLDNLLISVYQLVKSDLAMYRYWPIESVPPDWQSRRDDGIQTFEAWLNALENFFKTTKTRLSPADLKAIIGIRMQIKVAIIMLKTCIASGPEKSFDGFQDDFEDVVSTIESLTSQLQLPEAEPLNNETTSFTMELGIIHPLFFVAMKCRHRVLRRRAVIQLRKAGREGVWEGPIMAIVAEKLIAIEEKGVKAGEVIPERNRFHELRKNVDYDSGRVLLEATRAKGEDWREWEVLRMAIPF